MWRGVVGVHIRGGGEVILMFIACSRAILMAVDSFMAWHYCKKRDVGRVVYYCTWLIIMALM